TELPYMIMIVNVREQHRAALPAITHVNGSARVQTVSAKDNRDFHALLKAVGKTTGREMVLNTSFNVKGQPIVNTPSQAIKTFLGTGIEGLFLENYLITRKEQRAAPRSPLLRDQEPAHRKHIQSRSIKAADRITWRHHERLTRKIERRVDQ